MVQPFVKSSNNFSLFRSLMAQGVQIHYINTVGFQRMKRNEEKRKKFLQRRSKRKQRRKEGASLSKLRIYNKESLNQVATVANKRNH